MPNADNGEFLGAEELVKQQIGNLAISQLKRRRPNMKELLERITVAETALRGLPKLVEACDELIAAADSKDDAGHYEMVSDTERQLAKSVRALAKTQVGLAKSVRFMGTLLLPYLSGGNYTSDCCEMANKVGRGKEALHLMARSKFPDVFGGKDDKDGK